jgi:predicted nuclease of predicted toxin-antitoxin system
LQEADIDVFACAFREDRVLVTSDVGDFAKLARAGTVHAGLVFFEDGGLLRADQLRLARQALDLITGEYAASRDMVNRVLRLRSDSAHLFEPLP